MNLYSRIAYLARHNATAVAVEAASRSLTYADLDRLARQIARLLAARGVKRGDAVGLRLRDTPEHIAANFAVMRIGATVLPMDWRGTQPEHDRLVEQFRPPAVLVDDDASVGWSGAPAHVSEAASLAPDEGEPADAEGIPYVYLLTSGTTGLPKAMPVTHENLFARFAIRSLEGVFSRNDRFLAGLPVTYAAGREHALCVLLAGATLVLFLPLFEPSELVAIINGNAITAVSLSPNSIRALVEARHRHPVAMPALRAFVSTTGKLQPEDRALVRQFVSPRLIDYYGSTGTGMIAVIAAGMETEDPGVAGRPAAGIEVEIADEAGAALKPGLSGLVRVRGPSVVRQIVGAPGDQVEGFRDGWYYPGDYGSFGADGLLRLEGRAADLIKRGGLMVHAQEVEEALRKHPAVADAAVAGLASARLGQEVVAFVVLRAPLTERELAQHCRRELAPFKVPARFEFRTELPRNANSKVVKSLL